MVPITSTWCTPIRDDILYVHDQCPHCPKGAPSRACPWMGHWVMEAEHVGSYLTTRVPDAVAKEIDQLFPALKKLHQQTLSILPQLGHCQTKAEDLNGYVHNWQQQVCATLKGYPVAIAKQQVQQLQRTLAQEASHLNTIPDPQQVHVIDKLLQGVASIEQTLFPKPSGFGAIWHYTCTLCSSLYSLLTGYQAPPEQPESYVAFMRRELALYGVSPLAIGELSYDCNLFHYPQEWVVAMARSWDKVKRAMTYEGREDPEALIERCSFGRFVAEDPEALAKMQTIIDSNESSEQLLAYAYDCLAPYQQLDYGDSDDSGSEHY